MKARERLIGKIYMLVNTKSNGFNTSFYGWISSYVIFMLVGLISGQYYLVAIPFMILFAIATALDIRVPYYAFFAIIPFSVEVYFGTFGTDLPSEPLMLLLTGIGFLLFLLRWKRIDIRYITHPITMLMIAHVAWIAFASILSTDTVISFKYLLAKIWYIVPFYGLSFYMLKNQKELRKVMVILLSMLSLAVAIVLFRHAQYSFDFSMYNKVVQPIFRNHVNYASIQVVLLPFLWAIMRSAHSKTGRNTWIALIILFLLGINFSYTRAAQGCVILAIVYYFIIKWKLLKVAVSAALIGVILISSYLVYQNKYLQFAPDFERTITHRSYDNLIDATIKLEDISTMERVYRWVAAGHMVSKRPILGYGPNTFYSNYHKYTVTDFKTYVSDNPEKSGIHNYYLMILVEQGAVGLLIFLLLLFSIILKGEQVYNRLKDKHEKLFVMASILSILIISTLQLMNDLIESDKIGPFFFLSASIIVLYDIKLKSSEDKRRAD